MNDLDYWKDEGVDGKIILEHILKNSWESVGWIDLAQDREKLRAFVTILLDLLRDC
jgi:hypothetical protein